VEEEIWAVEKLRGIVGRGPKRGVVERVEYGGLVDASRVEWKRVTVFEKRTVQVLRKPHSINQSLDSYV